MSTPNGLVKRVSTIALTLGLLVGGASAAMAAYDNTWNFSGDFKASLQSSKFNKKADGSIRLSLTPSNCTDGYEKIYVQLVKVNALNAATWTSAKVSFPCNQTSIYTWTDRADGGYRLYFSRSGPTVYDENTKHISGTVSY